MLDGSDALEQRSRLVSNIDCNPSRCDSERTVCLLDELLGQRREEGSNGQRILAGSASRSSRGDDSYAIHPPTHSTFGAARLVSLGVLLNAFLLRESRARSNNSQQQFAPETLGRTYDKVVLLDADLLPLAGRAIRGVVFAAAFLVPKLRSLDLGPRAMRVLWPRTARPGVHAAPMLPAFGCLHERGLDAPAPLSLCFPGHARPDSSAPQIVAAQVPRPGLLCCTEHPAATTVMARTTVPQCVVSGPVDCHPSQGQQTPSDHSRHQPARG